MSVTALKGSFSKVEFSNRKTLQIQITNNFALKYCNNCKLIKTSSSSKFPRVQLNTIEKQQTKYCVSEQECTSEKDRERKKEEELK